MDEIKDMTDTEVQERIGQLNEELFRLRFRAATQPLEKPSLIRDLKKDIARLKTAQRQRELAKETR